MQTLLNGMLNTEYQEQTVPESNTHDLQTVAATRAAMHLRGLCSTPSLLRSPIHHRHHRQDVAPLVHEIWQINVLIPYRSTQHGGALVLPCMSRRCHAARVPLRAALVRCVAAAQAGDCSRRQQAQTAAAFASARPRDPHHMWLQYPKANLRAPSHGIPPAPAGTVLPCSVRVLTQVEIHVRQVTCMLEQYLDSSAVQVLLWHTRGQRVRASG